MAASLTLHEYDVLVPAPLLGPAPSSVRVVSPELYAWLEAQSIALVDGKQMPWVRRSRRGVQVTSYVGVVAAPGGTLIEILPKVGRARAAGTGEARALLLKMLRCQPHISRLRFNSAQLAADRMPMLEVFIGEFLRAVVAVTRGGLRSTYQLREDDLPTLRGKLLVSQQLRRNLTRADRFHTAHDEFSADRPENRLIHAALRKVLGVSHDADHQRLARELVFAFTDVPVSQDPEKDFPRVQLDRNMRSYRDALDWAGMVLRDFTPTSAIGDQQAPSLLFPMEKLFEAYVAHHLQKQLPGPFRLHAQAKRHHLVRHEGAHWFQLRPDLVVSRQGTDVLVMDTKWKLLDSTEEGGPRRYDLSQGDFYQLHAYGRSYLGGQGAVVLIYPRTDHFDQPLPVFDFPSSEGLQLWVLPFCLERSELVLPEGWAWPGGGGG